MAVIRMNYMSRALGFQTDVTICLPFYNFADVMAGKSADFYLPEGAKYQVLWLLHGGSGDSADYLTFSNIARYADENKIAVVMPSGYNMNYDDIDDCAMKMMTYVAEELPAYLRKILPLSDKREDNFIGGLSMGSNGAQKIAIRYPENYAAVLAMSAGSFYVNPGGRRRLNTGMPMPPHKDDEMEENIEIAKRNVAEGKLLPKFFMTWGDKDFVREGHKASAEFLKETGYDVYAEEVPGYGHEWDFWDLTLKKALKEWLPIRHDLLLTEK